MKNKTIILLIMISVLLVPSYAFNDVHGHWAKAEIDRWVDAGYVNGYPDGSFRPDNTVTTVELLKLIDNVVGLDYISQNAYNGAELNNVNQNDWYYDLYLKALSAKLIDAG